MKHICMENESRVWFHCCCAWRKKQEQKKEARKIWKKYQASGMLCEAYFSFERVERERTRVLENHFVLCNTALGSAVHNLTSFTNTSALRTRELCRRRRKKVNFFERKSLPPATQQRLAPFPMPLAFSHHEHIFHIHFHFKSLRSQESCISLRFSACFRRVSSRRRQPKGGVGKTFHFTAKKNFRFSWAETNTNESGAPAFVLCQRVVLNIRRCWCKCATRRKTKFLA